MQDYRTLTLENIYAPDEITDALSLLQSCGIESIVNPSNITLNFDIVDLKMLESTTQNTPVQKTLEELYKIRSFSSQNGEILAIISLHTILSANFLLMKGLFGKARFYGKRITTTANTALGEAGKALLHHI